MSTRSTITSIFIRIESGMLPVESVNAMGLFDTYANAGSECPCIAVRSKASGLCSIGPGCRYRPMLGS